MFMIFNIVPCKTRLEKIYKFYNPEWDQKKNQIMKSISEAKYDQSN
jgi:hypothetical protein